MAAGRTIATALSRGLMILTAAGVLAYGAGFIRFSDDVMALHETPSGAAADAAVVLTGNSNERLRAGVLLLEQGRAARLLISGVNERTSEEEVRLIAGGSRELHACCITLDRNALDTIGNAREIARWVRSSQARSLFLVTENYHMPRALTEVRRAVPGVDVIPYVVRQTPYLDRQWWRDERAVRGLWLEYNKYLFALVRNRAPLEQVVNEGSPA